MSWDLYVVRSDGTGAKKIDRSTVVDGYHQPISSFAIVRTSSAATVCAWIMLKPVRANQFGAAPLRVTILGRTPAALPFAHECLIILAKCLMEFIYFFQINPASLSP